jgi:UDP-N-acetylmuramate dehydrogenase
VTIRLQENIPLAGLTTLGIGGPARFLVEVSDPEGLGEAVAMARTRRLPILVLGGGSNLLVSDDGFPGLAIRMRIPGVHWDGPRVRAGAGVNWDTLVAEAVERGFAGIECLGGIPGSVGATPVQNVGAYGQEVGQVISTVRVYDLDDDVVRDLSAEDCGFEYRTSGFNSTSRGRYVILAVDYTLRSDGCLSLTYPDLERELAGRPAPTLVEVRDAVLTIRRRKAMLLVNGDPDCHSAGSFFRNPVLTPAGFDALGVRCREIGLDAPPPAYRAGDSVKIPAAWLVEQAGFPKGTTDGAVGVSTKHALALINRGGAQAADVLRFAGAIRDAVEDHFGIRLRTEPVFVGFPGEVASGFGAVVV